MIPAPLCFSLICCVLCSVATHAFSDDKMAKAEHAVKSKHEAAAPVENILRTIYLGKPDPKGFRQIYLVANKPLKNGEMKLNERRCNLQAVKWETGLNEVGFPYICNGQSVGPKEKLKVDVTAWDENGNRRYKVQASTPNEKGTLAMDTWTSVARKDINLQKEFLESLSPGLQEFVRIYQKERPHMKFDSTLSKFAHARAVYCMTVQGGHAPDVNGQLKNTGYGISSSIPDQGNQFESLWGKPENDPRGALEGWKGHPGHREHVLGLLSPWSEHTRFGIGFYNGQWVFISAPEPIGVLDTASK